MLAFVILFVTFALLAYRWLRQNFNYWTKRGIPQVDVNFPFNIIQRERTFVYSFRETYEKFKGKTRFVGLYNLFQPMLMVIDEEALKQIMVKDFNYFQSRGNYHNEAADPLSAHLFNIDNPKWRALRTKLTPTFTSGKMKSMYPIVRDIGEKLKQVMDGKVARGEQGVDMREMFAKFTTDIIGTCAFGIECNCLFEEVSEFRNMGMLTFTNPRNPIPVQFMMIAWPELARTLGRKHIRDDVTEFFTRIVNETVEYRLANNIKRNDFVDLLIELRNEQKSNSMVDAHLDGLSMNEIAAQCFVFFVAGFETSSTASGFTIYELARNQKVQDKLRAHIRDVLRKHDGQLTYEALKDMDYLEQCLNEGMRLYPPLPLLSRRTTDVYKLSETHCVLPKGTFVGIPVFHIHRDPKNYPDPDKYDPDRFSPENVAQRHPFSFLPFGEGPRNCIGERFGMMQAKLGMAILIGNYRFTLNPNSAPLSFSKKAFILAPENKLLFDVEKVE